LFAFNGKQQRWGGKISLMKKIRKWLRDQRLSIDICLENEYFAMLLIRNILDFELSG
jgi:hypothetical protein